jgi:aryl-alcohol dehydrogenase-like predicted oxidoreductase
LQTDYIDLYQLHNPRIAAIERDDLFACLEQLKDEGKVREYGVALGPALGWRREGVAAMEEQGVACVQTVYNVLEQKPGDEFLEVAERCGAGVMARVPTASGLLEDRFAPDTVFDKNDHRRFRLREDPDWLKQGLAKAEQLRFLTRDGERTLAQAALQFALAQPGMTSVVPTVTSLAELEEWSAVGNGLVRLSPEELQRVDELYRDGLALGTKLRV